MTETIEGIDLHRADFVALFDDIQRAKQSLRGYAEPFARAVLDAAYFDETNTWTGWDVQPIQKDGVLIALEFGAISYDDRGPTRRSTVRVAFPQFDAATYSL